MTPAQLKAARKLLGWSRDRLAGASNVPPHAVTDYEHGSTRGAVTPERLAAIRAALEAASIEFTNGDAPGVRLRDQGGSR